MSVFGSLNEVAFWEVTINRFRGNPDNVTPPDDSDTSSNGVSPSKGIPLGVCADTVVRGRSRGFPFRISLGFALIQSPGDAHWVSCNHVHDGLPVSCACTVCASIRPANPNPKSGDHMHEGILFPVSCACTACTQPSGYLNTPGDCISAPRRL